MKESIFKSAVQDAEQLVNVTRNHLFFILNSVGRLHHLNIPLCNENNEVIVEIDTDTIKCKDCITTMSFDDFSIDELYTIISSIQWFRDREELYYELDAVLGDYCRDRDSEGVDSNIHRDYLIQILKEIDTNFPIIEFYSPNIENNLYFELKGILKNLTDYGAEDIYLFLVDLSNEWAKAMDN